MTWTCSECGETHADRDSKVPGGCLDCVDLLRYIEYEAPGMGIVHNDVSEVVCCNEECDSRVKVAPETLVEKDDSAVSVESEEYDMEAGEPTGATRVEIYCSPTCRNEQYAVSDGGRDGGCSGGDSA